MKDTGTPLPDRSRDLEAYQAAAWADADSHFDDRALDAQRLRILQRLRHLGQTARVIRFPGTAGTARPALQVHRRWISVAAAAGLVIGLVGGQMLHPPSPRSAPSDRVTLASGSQAREPEPLALATDDGLLQAIEAAVELHSTAELRALDELTPFREPR